MAYSTKTDSTQNTRHRQTGQRIIALSMPFIPLLIWLVIAQPCRAARAVAQQDPSRVTTDNLQAVTLEPGKPIERELAGGDVHAYTMKLTARQFANAVVDQRGIDVVVSVFAPDGKQLVRIDSPNNTHGPEPVTLIAEASGTYRLEVSSRDKAAAAGRYEAKLNELRTARPEDKKLIELNELINIGSHHYERGLEVARFENGIDNYALALEYYRKSLPLSEAAGDKALLALTLQAMGRINRLQGNYAQALAYENTSLKLSEELGSKIEIASTLDEMGWINFLLADYDQALDYESKSLKLCEELKNETGAVITMNTIAQINFLQGNYAPALEYYHKSLKLSEEMGSKTRIANTLTSMSLVYRATGDFAKALDSAQGGLAVHESLSNKNGAANAQMNIGIVYGSMGDYARALEHYRRSLALSEELGRQGLIANALDKIADAFNAQGNYEQALVYAQRSLKLNEETKNYRQTIFSILTNGNIHQSRGEYAQALDYFQRALGLSEKSGDKREIVDALIGISSAHFGQGNYAPALDATQRAAAVARQIGNRELLLSALNQTAFSYLSLNQLENARRASEQAIELVESLRASVAGNEARSSYFASARYPYDLDVDVLMRLDKQTPGRGYAAAAFQMSERARARSLLETLSEAHADIRKGVDPLLLENERTLQQRLNAAAERQTRILSSKHTEEQAVRLRKEIDALTSEYQQVESRVRQSSPSYAALTQPVPLTISEIQRNVLDTDTALLEYALGDDRSYLWVVTPTAVKSFELPKRAEIETSVRRVVGLLSDGKRWATNVQINAEYGTASDQLSRTLLPPALMSELQVKRLVIVGDGALQYLPFGALPSSSAELTGVRRQGSVASGIANPPPTSNPRPPLIADYEIVSLPSASTLAVLRRETANRPRPTKSVAILADPVFEETDERVHAAMAHSRQVTNGQSTTSTPEASFDRLIKSRALLRAFDFRASSDSNGAAPEQLKITRLPFTRFEAEGILKAAPASQSFKAIDFRANRETATSADLAQYRFVHFATHGILNSEHPELSGIVLSLVNERGQPADGFLRLNEIYNLNLPADLVVLSACQTGLGKEIRGEGLVGLTRGFMYAGAPRVVASLWKVDDAATAELMKRFYQGMLRDNLRPAAALRAAKVEMWKQKRWNAPFYWAAFELQGEWK